MNSALNLADDASRGLNGAELKSSCRWITGPPFLSLAEEQWPRSSVKISRLTDGDPEVKKGTTLLTTAAKQEGDIMDKLWNRYSSWYRLLKAIAWIRRFIRWRFGTKEDTRHRESRLSVRELEEARLAILRCIQKRHFAEELEALQGSRQVRRSAVSRLEPHLDTDSLIRVGGCLN